MMTLNAEVVLRTNVKLDSMIKLKIKLIPVTRDQLFRVYRHDIFLREIPVRLSHKLRLVTHFKQADFDTKKGKNI